MLVFKTSVKISLVKVKGDRVISLLGQALRWDKIGYMRL